MAQLCKPAFLGLLPGGRAVGTVAALPGCEHWDWLSAGCGCRGSSDGEGRGGALTFLGVRGRQEAGVADHTVDVPGSVLQHVVAAGRATRGKAVSRALPAAGLSPACPPPKWEPGRPQGHGSCELAATKPLCFLGGPELGVGQSFSNTGPDCSFLLVFSPVGSFHRWACSMFMS